MRKLLILTALLALTSSALGCRWCDKWCRGASADPVIMAPANACDPCAAPAPCAVPACAPACGPCAPAYVPAGS